MKTLEEIKEWFHGKTNCKINMNFIVYFVQNGLLKPHGNGLYAFDSFIEYFVQKENGVWLTNDSGLLVIKPSFIKANAKYEEKNEEVNKRYKITSLGGNKLKVIKLK